MSRGEEEYNQMKRKWDTVWADPGEATEGMFEKDFIG